MSFLRGLRRERTVSASTCSPAPAIIGITIFGAGLDPAIDATIINEGFADWFAGQLAGGANRLRGETAASSYVGDQLEGTEDYCFGIAGCFDDNVTGVPMGDPLNDRASQVSTIIHDMFDGPTPLGVDQPHNGAVWTPTPPGCVSGACMPSLPILAPPTPELGDDGITLGGGALPAWIAFWMLDPIEGRIFSLDTVMHAATRTMRLSGIPEGTLTAMYALHNAGPVPPLWLLP